MHPAKNTSTHGPSHYRCPPTLYYARTKGGISLHSSDVAFCADPLLTHYIRSASPLFGCVLVEESDNRGAMLEFLRGKSKNNSSACYLRPRHSARRQVHLASLCHARRAGQGNQPS